jgi:hypothetical protein
MPGQGEALVQKWESAETYRRMFEPLWQELSDYILPRKSNISLRRSPGVRQTDVLFDSTAINANELLAASMQGTLTSASIKWFGLRIRGFDLYQDQEVNRWLEACSRRMYDALRQSNFASESHECYLDLGAFGTGALYESERDPSPYVPFSGLQFKAIPVGDFCIDEDGDGRVDLFMYRQRFTPRAAVNAFGAGNLPERYVEMAKLGEQQSQYEFLHVVHRRKDVGFSGNGASIRFPWASIWVDLETKMVVREGGFREFPFMVPRWSKTAGETYGRGPGHTSLPDVRTLNKLVELKLRALAKAVDPPVKVRDNGVIGDVRLNPGGMTHVRDQDAVVPMELGGRFDVVAFEEDKFRMSIRRIYYSDQLQLQEGPQMTAYEVQVRYELMQRILGPTLGRLEVEFLNPVVERTFNIMLRRGQFPQPPGGLERLSRRGGMLDVEYEGPLAKAQRLSESVGIQRFFQVVLPVTEADPSVLDNVDMDAVVQHHGLSVGVPAGILRDPDEVKKIRAARAAAQNEERKVEVAGATAEAAGKAAPMIKALIEAQQAGIIPAGGQVASRPVNVG